MLNATTHRSRLDERCVEYLFMLILVLSNNSIYNANRITSAKFLALAVALLIIPISIQIILMHSDANAIRLINFFFIYFAAVTLFVGISSIYGKGQFISSFILFFPASVLYCYARYLDDKFFVSVKRFANTVSFFAVISLVFWILFSNMHIFPGFTMYSPWSGNNIVNYYWIHFDTQQQILFGKNLVRNTGVFTEAPMYAYILLCALLTELFVNEKSRMKIITLLMVTIITTFSTTGIILGIVAILIKIIYRYLRRENVLASALIVTAIVVAIYIIKIALMKKTNSTSGALRNDDIKAGILAWKAHPIFGNGFNNGSAITKEMALWRVQQGKSASLGFTSGLLQVLNDGGVYLLTLYILPFIQAFKDIKKYGKHKDKLCALLIMMCALMVTITPYNSATLYLLALMYVYYFFTDTVGMSKNSLMAQE